jgi:hypothetical protein
MVRGRSVRLYMSDGSANVLTFVSSERRVVVAPLGNISCPKFNERLESASSPDISHPQAHSVLSSIVQTRVAAYVFGIV